MRSLLPALLIVASVAACAGTYDDFGRGLDANNRGDSEAAVMLFTRSIERGDLAKPYLPSAHLGRARAHLELGECADALEDLNTAIELDPGEADAYSVRAETEACLDKSDAALADATAAIRLKPAAGYYFTRAQILWTRGRFEGARNDTVRAATLDPRNPYFLLWAAMASQRLGEPNELARRAAAFDKDSWPGALLDLFGGRMAPDEIYRAAARGSGRTSSNQKCETDFYVGEWQFARGNFTVARNLLLSAATECPHNDVAFRAAQGELRRWAES
jgi:lipoprotein NlpI